MTPLARGDDGSPTAARLLTPAALPLIWGHLQQLKVLRPVEPCFSHRFIDLAMQEKSPALHPLAFVTVAANVVVLLFLAWHLAFEAIPEAISDLGSSRSLAGRLAATVVLLPYVAVLIYLMGRVRSCILQWRTAAAVLASIAGYIVLCLVVGFYMVSLSMPA